jgi:hypothetical protein
MGSTSEIFLIFQQAFKRIFGYGHTCRRAGNDYPRFAAVSHRGLKALASAYAGRRCGRNAAGLLVCPHKGFVLGSLVSDKDGRVVCPLHGLVIDVAAGAVVGGKCAEAA